MARTPFAFALTLVCAVQFFLFGAPAGAGGYMPEPRRIIVIGDSHVAGPMGATLHRLLREKFPNASVSTHGLAGAIPQHFFHSDPARRTLRMGYIERVGAEVRRVEYGTPATAPWVRELLAESPDLFIVEFGENYANYGGAYPAATIARQVEGLAAEIVTAPGYRPENCFWITPTYGENRAPYYKNDERLFEVIAGTSAAVNGRCRMIDSTQLPGFAPGMVGTVDGIHLTSEWGARWGEGVATQLEGIL